MAHRLPLPLQSGVPAASTFSESLADADDAALKHLRFALINISLKFGHFGSPLCIMEFSITIYSITMTILNFQENSPFSGS